MVFVGQPDLAEIYAASLPAAIQQGQMHDVRAITREWS
jgi:hypothetical protein